MDSRSVATFGPLDFLRLLRGTTIAAMLGLVFLQEAFSATTTWLVIQIARGMAEGDPHASGFVWIVVAQALSYLAGSASWIYAERAGFGAFERYMFHFADQNLFQTSLLTHTEARENTEPFLTSETFRVGFELTYDLQFYLRLLFNLILNALVLGAAIDISLPFAFGLAFAVLTLIQWLLRKPLAAAYLRSQEMTNRMTARTYNAWDNIFSGNRYNLAIWQRDFRQRVDSALHAQIKAILAREGWSSTSGVIALLIVLCATAHVVIAGASDTALLIGIAATLPRQIEMTVDMYQLTAGFTEMLAVWTRIKGICAHMRPLPDPTFEQRINLERIALLEGDVEKRFSSVAGAAQYLLSRPAGLISIRGDNGVGKSTLLILLKESLRGEAYYWPSHDRLSFEINTEMPIPIATDRIMVRAKAVAESIGTGEIRAKEQGMHGYSSGERQIEVLREIAAKTDHRVYLLDEWDANLDAANRASAQEIVDDLAQRSLVIEISHRDQK